MQTCFDGETDLGDIDCFAILRVREGLIRKPMVQNNQSRSSRAVHFCGTSFFWRHESPSWDRGRCDLQGWGRSTGWMVNPIAMTWATNIHQPQCNTWVSRMFFLFPGRFKHFGSWMPPNRDPFTIFRPAPFVPLFRWASQTEL